MTSSIGMWRLKGREFSGPSISTGIMYDDKGNPIHSKVKIRQYTAEDSVRSMAQGADSIFYFVLQDNLISLASQWRNRWGEGGRQ
ncbi:MAG: hypothetical protein IPP02_04875 [Chitinophagaceae bacterium]|nr:hypothetical protein [Chitinophagaceae bacterium]